MNNNTVEKIGFWIGIISGIIGIVSIFSNEIIFFTSCFIVVLIVILIISLRIIDLKKSTLIIEDLDMSAFHSINKEKRPNHDLLLEHSESRFIINRGDVESFHKFDGVIKETKNIIGMEYIFPTGNFAPLENLDMYAFDLVNDPNEKIQIDCELVSNRGLVKTAFIPFLHPLNENDDFSIKIHRDVKGAMIYGKDYAYSYIPFKLTKNGKSFSRFTYIAFDKETAPSSVRVYRVDRYNRVERCGIMNKSYSDDKVIFEEDVLSSLFDVRVYIFERKEPSEEK